MTTTLDLPFQLGQPQQAGAITMTPLFPLRDPVCDYVSLDEALAGGLDISEVNEAGDVGELAVRNPLDRGVLLYDGEELVGAKQNRILNVSVLLGAGSTARIPVSCVESGRWAWRAPPLLSGGARGRPRPPGPPAPSRVSRAAAGRGGTAAFGRPGTWPALSCGDTRPRRFAPTGSPAAPLSAPSGPPSTPSWNGSAPSRRPPPTATASRPAPPTSAACPSASPWSRASAA